MISQEKKLEIKRILDVKLGAVTCQMCHQDSFIIADGYLNNKIQDNLDGFEIGGPTLPTVSIICTKCGFVSQHALGVLGLLPNNNEGNREK